MWKDLAKQMIPFVILLAVLWLVAEFLERTFTSGPRIVAPPVQTAPNP